MSKYANAGELRTPITIKNRTTSQDADGFPIETWSNVFGGNLTINCKWENAHGIEAIEAQRLGLTELATLTMRYSPRITATCRIFKSRDTDPFEIISLDNVRDHNLWLEVKVSRKTAT